MSSLLHAVSRLSIRRKLQWIIMLTVSAALLLVCGALLASSLMLTRNTMKGELELLGQMIAQNSTAALTFHDQDAARELLLGLRTHPSLTAGVLFSPDG